VNDKICAVVVTYNRSQLLKECLLALQNQSQPLHKIIVINNASTDETILMLKNNFPNVLTINLEENQGASGGFHEGIKAAYKGGYDWIWVMDDDAEPFNDTLKTLIEYSEKNNAKALCPLIIGENEMVQSYHHKRFNFLGREVTVLKNTTHDTNSLISEDANGFVGPLIHRDIVKKIGFPIKNFFIIGEDNEYTLRISRAFKLFLCRQAKIRHKDKNYSFQKVLPKEQRWKLYFGIRNRIIISKIHLNIFQVFFLTVWITLSIFRPSNFKNDLRKIRLKGLKDGLKIIFSSKKLHNFINTHSNQKRYVPAKFAPPSF